MRRNKKGQFVQRENSNKYDGFSIYRDANGYPIVYVAGKEIKLHIFVWEKKNGRKPEGMQLHHKDFDKSNYKYENLKLVTQSDHLKIHAGWIKDNGKWVSKPCSGCNEILTLDKFYKRKGFTPSAKCKKCHCAQTKKWALSNPERRKEIGRKYYHKHKGGSCA